MNLTQTDLLSNENVILEKDANAVIKLTDYGLSKFAFDKYMWAIGMKGKEAIGGKIYLTNYRLIFKSHNINRVKGKFSIFLHTINSIRDSSFLITKKISVTTKLSEYSFVIWGIPAFIKETEVARNKITENDIMNMQSEILSNYEKCGEGLKIFGGMEALNKIFLTGGKAQQLFDLVTNPLEGLGVMALEELFDRGIVESWQKKFE